MTDAVRVPLPADEELSPEIRQTLAGIPPLNVFRMVAGAPASFRPFMELVRSILLDAELDAGDREIAVLRVAHVTGSEYEWTQHVTLAKNVGLSDEQIAAIAAAGPVTGLDEAGTLLCRVADEISRDVRLSDEALAQVLERYGRRQATELILCVSYFNMLSRFLESTRVELEGEDLLAGRTPEDVGRAADAR